MEIKIRTAQGDQLSQIAAEFGIDRKTARKLRDAEAELDPAFQQRANRDFVERVVGDEPFGERDRTASLHLRAILERGMTDRCQPVAQTRA